MITVYGANGIKATVLAHSISSVTNKPLITWEIEYPRLILAELNTHRMLSRNSFSSRAVPFMKMLEQLQGEPVRFGANQAGMQDKGEDHTVWPSVKVPYAPNVSITDTPQKVWAVAKKLAIAVASAFHDAGYHKQVYNRLLEPWQMQKTILSATEVDNFFWLRDDDAADPTIRELARVMREAMVFSIPEVLQPGEWHLPYIDWIRTVEGTQKFFINEHGVDRVLTLDEAIKVSCARCAAVSYRNEGYGLAKSLDIYDKLVGSDKKHASAFEHCGTPMRDDTPIVTDNTFTVWNKPFYPKSWEDGISHVDRQGKLWSGNFCGWIQYRKLIPGECYNAQ